jgi:FKBP-type peptidyl-prolyl cis-trans isomerase 2
MPELALGDYKGIEAARRTRPVTDEEIERVVENLREASASLQPVEDRAAEPGDTVTVDIQGRYVEPEEEEGINASDVDVVLGGEGVLAEFNENLTGVQPDEVKTFTVTYPDDFGPGGRQAEGEERKGLAGKTVEYTATVTAVRRKEVPALDDDWVKSLGEEEVETVEQLRARVRENLTKSAEHESEHRLRDEVLGRLIERHRFEVPETLVSYQANQILQSMIRDMISRGADPRTQDINWEAMRDLVRERAGDDAAAVIFQQPNVFGILENAPELAAAAKDAGALAIAHVDPVSLGVLEAPGNYGADLAIGEGQSAGNYQSYAGPHYGFLASKAEYTRRLPGRIIGETTDLNGDRGYVLTLQTREQHIRREKATSNMTTNQTLLALAGLVHLSWLGPQGIREVGETCMALGAYAKERLVLPLAFPDRPTFKEVAFRTSRPARDVVRDARELGVHPGYAIGRDYEGMDDVLLVAVTEKRTPADVDRLAEVLREVDA